MIVGCKDEDTFDEKFRIVPRRRASFHLGEQTHRLDVIYVSLQEAAQDLPLRGDHPRRPSLSR